MNAPICSIFFHNYYGNDPEWLRFFATQFTVPYTLFYNGVASSYHRIIQGKQSALFQQLAPNMQLVPKQATNKGKDIGGKLVLMDAYLKLDIKSEYIVLLHDKTSPYHNNNEQWKKNLFRIAEKQYQDKILSIFSKNPQVGIIASEHTIRNELDNERKWTAYTDSTFIKGLKHKYNIQPPHLNYVAGTMFWVRAVLFELFFKQYPPLEIRATLEEGNVTDEAAPTLTHAWERLLCWIITAQGYQMKSI